jgi:ribosomal protein S6--L-glutamate ligase
VLDTLRFSISVEQESPSLKLAGKPLRHYDAVIPRIGASITHFGTAVVRQFEQMGTFTLNTSHAISISRDKLRSLQVLSRHDIGMPATAFVRDKHDVLPAIEQVGGVPVIIKLLEGTQGIGVILADRVSVAAAIIETLQSTRQNVLIQKFVAESKGRDVRALVVGGEVVAAMRRVAHGQEFRSNVHRGGSTEALALDPQYARTAVRAAHLMGLRMAGVDMLEGEDGPKVMEVNSSPGLEGIETATGIDVAGAVIEHIEEQVNFPDIDLRQRLTLHAGYGIAEFPVIKRSSLAGKTVAETGLREQDVLILNIDRNGVVIPNPRGSREILVGDKLLCFGKILTLKSLVPPKKKPRKKRIKPVAPDAAVAVDRPAE